MRSLEALAVAMLVLLSTGAFASSTFLLPSPIQISASSPIQITSRPSFDRDPEFSPDGRQIAYSSNVSGTFDIWLMNADGRHQTRLTSMPGNETNPKWSHDGREVAFFSTEIGVGTDILVVDVGGGGITRITDDGCAKETFEWSPSGRMLAYDSDRGGFWNIWVVDLQANSSNRITNVGNNKYPSWTADGEHILFTSSNQLGSSIYIVAIGGGSPIRLTASAGSDIRPRMSPDGQKVVFLSNGTGAWRFWMMNSTGGEQINVLEPQTRDIGNPSILPLLSPKTDFSWNRDSQKIAFSSFSPTTGSNIYVINLNATFVVQLLGMIDQVVRGTSIDRIYGTQNSLFPAWSADGGQIIFSAGNQPGRMNLWLEAFREVKAVSQYGG